ncbi:MAG: hypothetical protein H7282_08035 [Cytophagaceae bacterium]|nr:hypothetical protein [Cytophagaceae bacterium]
MIVKHFLTGILLTLMVCFQSFAIDDDSNHVAPDVYLTNETFYSTALLDALNEADDHVSVNGGFSPMPLLSADIRNKRDSVSSAMQMMDKTGAYADQIPDKIDMLPVGIKKTINNLEYTLMLTNLTASAEEGTTISAYLRILTKEGKMMMLGAEGIKLNSNGGVSDMKLILLGYLDIPMGKEGKYRIVLKGGELNKTNGLASTPMTYAIVGCQGLKELNLVGEFELSNDLVIPVDKDLKAQTESDQTVKAPFSISVKNWNDLVVQLTLPAFEMRGLEGWVFNARNAVLDMSDTKNAPAMAFPAGYQNKYYAGNSMLWRGVYIQQLDVVLPEQFADKETKVRSRFTGQTMIIDHQGVSGIYSIRAPILTLGKGSASGWKFSVNQVMLGLEANKLTQGGFGGDLILPINTKNKDTIPLSYNAIINDKDEYLLTVKLTDSLNFDMMSAQLVLRENSYIKMDYIRNEEGNRKLKPLAVLTGDMIITSMFKGKITFTELRLFTEAPYIGIKGIMYTNQNKVSQFPVSISKLGLAEATIDGRNCLELIIGVAVNIDAKKIKGNTVVSLSAYYDKPPGDYSEGNWKFYKFRLKEVHLEAEVSGLVIKGTIIFMQDDPLYGNGFYGDVTITYNDKFGISSTCIFGATPEFRYWYVYGRIDLPTAIPIVGPFQLQAFGGGAYSRMSIAPKGSTIPYVPDVTAGFGVKALVGYVVSKKEVIFGDLMFEMNFNSNGGIKYIAFFGSANVVAGGGALGGIVDKLKEADQVALAATNPADAQKIASGNVQQVAKSMPVGKKPVSSIFAYIGIQYNFETSTLEANSEIFITLGVLKGRGPNNRAGWMDFHMSPGRWYCYAGTPEDRLGITLSLAGIHLETGSYFMVGTEMPTFPDPPQKVINILGPELYPAKNNISEGSLKTGSGFAFGLDLTLRADINFMILYTHMEAGVGGDIMLRQYPDAHCQGSTAALGINNWYANGRVYTYLEGEIGVKVDLMFIHVRIPIINGAAAAMLEAGGPNPTWAKGYLRVRFSVLGGKVSGDMKMKMSLGEECVIVSNTQAPVSFKIISDVSPATNATEVDVFTYPQIAFNVGVEEPFEINDDNGSRLFRVKINTLEMNKGNTLLDFVKTWTNNKQTLTLTTENTLPSESTVELKVKVSFEELKDNNWTVYVVNGKIPVEEQTISFKTSKAPTDIPHRNIAYMYPAHQQKNVYREEARTGYVILKQWQDYLLDADVENNKLIKLTAKGKPSIILETNLDRKGKKIAFDITSLENETSYAIELIARPKVAGSTSSDNTTTTIGDSTSGSYSLEDNKAQAVVQNDGDKLLLGYEFGTSKYTTLSAKLREIASGINNIVVYQVNADYLNVRTRRYEHFDSTELFGSIYTADVPLINYQSLLTDAYYQNTIFPKIYKSYPYSGVSGNIVIKDREVSEYGFPPVKAMYHDPEYDLDPNRMPYINGLADVYRKDFKDIENQVINQYVNGNGNLLSKYPQFFTRFPEPPLNNTDQIEFSYLMPGSIKGTSGVINYKR